MVEDDYGTSLAYGLRPVINLKNTLKFSGDGTKNNPYVPSLQKIIKNVKKDLVRQNTHISCYIIGREPLVVRRPLEGGLV